MDVWYLNDPAYSGLLSSLLEKKDKSSMTLGIVLDFSEPANAVDELEKWIPCIEDLASSLTSSCDKDELHKLKLTG
jgi:hypothetical protein